MATFGTLVRWATASDSLLIVWSLIAKTSLLMLLALTFQIFWDTGAAAVKHLVLRAGLVAVWAVTGLTVIATLAPSTNLPLDPVTLTVPTAVAGSTAIASYGAFALPLLPWLIAIWAVGLVAFGIRYLRSVIRVRHIAANAVSAEDSHIAASMQHIIEEFRVARPTTIRLSGDVNTAVVWGLRRPIVILPDHVADWTSAQVTMALRHELAHVARRDVFWLNLASASAVVFWFNPLAWLLRKSLRQASEYTCDNYVLSSGIAAPDYADHLLAATVEARGANRHLSPGVVPGGNFFLEDRIMSVLKTSRRILAPGRWLRGSLSIIALVLVFGLTLVALDATAGSEDTKKPAVKSKTASEDLPAEDEFVKVDQTAEMIHYETPDYPEEALKKNQTGKVWIKALVSKDGEVLKSKVLKSSGYPLLDDAARTAASKCRFKPAIWEGEPVAMWVTYKVTFDLGDKSEAEEASADSSGSNWVVIEKTK